MFFAATILLAPFRLRLDVWTRPFYPVYHDYTDFLLFVSDFTLFFMLVFWLCSLIVEPRRVGAGNPVVFILLTGLTLAAWVSVLGSVDAIITRYQAVRFVFLLFYYLYIVNEITLTRWVLVPVALQAIAQVPVAAGQSFLQSSLGLQVLGERVLDPAVRGASIVPVAGERILRAYGFADHPNILGGCLAFSMILLFAVILYGRHRNQIFAGICFLLAFPPLVLTFSRSAWLSLFAGIGFLVMFEAVNRRWESLTRAFLLGLTCVSIVSPLLPIYLSVIEKRFNSGNVAEDGPMIERAYLMNSGNTLFVEHSAIGVGLGASPLAMKLRFEEFPVNFQPPHYVPLTAALETGVAGGIFYLLLFLFPIFDFIFRWRVYIQNPAGMGVIALLLVISVVNLFDYYTWSYAPGRLWQWLAWGLYSAAMKEIV